jgi:hypothetical protein
MNSFESYQYIPSIPLNRSGGIDRHFGINAQSLTFQDVYNGGAEDPLIIANPDDEAMVDKQLEWMAADPKAYSGYVDKQGNLVAMKKSGEWLYGSELDFVNPAKALALRAYVKKHGGSLPQKAYGDFSLVASESLEGAQEGILRDLLVRSIGEAAATSAFVHNIVLHDNDPLIDIVSDYGFQPVGKRAEVKRVPGLIQQRYQRSI